MKLLPDNLYPAISIFDVKTNQVTNRELKKIIKIAGIDKNITFHSARHTFATMLLERGVDISIVRKLVGHRNLSTTLIYAKISRVSLIRGIDKINNL